MKPKDKTMRAKIHAMFYSGKTGYDIAQALDIEQSFVYRVIEDFRTSERQSAKTRRDMIVIDTFTIQETSLLLSREPTHNFILITNNKMLKNLAKKLGFFDK